MFRPRARLWLSLEQECMKPRTVGLETYGEPLFCPIAFGHGGDGGCDRHYKYWTSELKRKLKMDGRPYFRRLLNAVSDRPEHRLGRPLARQRERSSRATGRS